MVKIANTSFNEEAIKKMTLKEFTRMYADILKGQDAGEVYRAVTGAKKIANKSSQAEKLDDGCDVGQAD